MVFAAFVGNDHLQAGIILGNAQEAQINPDPYVVGNDLAQSRLLETKVVLSGARFGPGQPQNTRSFITDNQILQGMLMLLTRIEFPLRFGLLGPLY